MRTFLSFAIAAGITAASVGAAIEAANATASQSVGDYQVNVRRCAGAGSDVDYTFPGTAPGLAAASQQEVDSLTYGFNHPGINAQVRLVQFDTPTVTELVSSHDFNTC